MTLWLGMALALMPDRSWTTDGADPYYWAMSAGPGMVAIGTEFPHKLMVLTQKDELRESPIPDEVQIPRVLDLGTARGVRILCHMESPPYDMVDCLDPTDVILEGDRGDTVPDIDGDGLPDIHGYYQVYLQRGDGWLATPYPDRSPAHSYHRWIPVGDLDADGHADLLYAEDTDLVGNAFNSGHIALFRGTPSGYAPLPSWELDIDAPIIDAFAMQMDDDPPLELFLQGGDYWYTTLLYPGTTVVYQLELGEEGPMAHRLFESYLNRIGSTTPIQIAAVDDTDGDGLDDLAFIAGQQDDDGLYTATILASTERFHIDRPSYKLTANWLLDPDAYGFIDAGLVVDIDGDGYRDIVTVAHAGLEDETYVDLWYGPIGVERTSPETGLPTDTGQTTTPTGPTAHTGTNIDPDVTDPIPSTEAKGCGCDQSGSPWAVLTLLPFFVFTRRHGATPCT